MKDLATAVVIAVSAIILLLISRGDGYCVGDDAPELGDNSTCSSRADFATALCRLRCLFCHFGNVSQPFGCITEGQNGTCLCLKRESGEGNGTTTVEPTPPIETTSLPGEGDGESSPSEKPSPPEPREYSKNGINVG